MPPKDHQTSRFLAEAAILLAVTSPAVSAQLNATRRDFDEQTSPQDSANRTSSCSACGTLFVLGWNCKILKPLGKKRTRQDRLAGKDRCKKLRIECSRCNAITQIESIEPQKSNTQVEQVKTAMLPPELPQQSSAPSEHKIPLKSSTPPASAEAGIKKRSRSKKSTLQALLADRKPTEAKKGLGLDLMDFMKT